MKNERSDRRWILFIIVLLIIEISWLLIDFRIIKISLFSNKEKISEAREAGFVINVQEQLKRRGANSLVWEATSEKEVLYFQDSILTLANSTARLNLKEQTLLSKILSYNEKRITLNRFTYRQPLHNTPFCAKHR